MVPVLQPLTALVNNAGLGPAVPLEFHELADAKRVFDTNLFGVLYVMREEGRVNGHLKGREGRQGLSVHGLTRLGVVCGMAPAVR